MSFIELFFLAAGLSMDAFAAAVCLGLAIPKASLQKSLIVGLYFGAFQAVMPLIGYLFAVLFADRIIAYDHWIAFLLLGYLGGKMIVGSYQKDGCPDRECSAEACNDRACPGGIKPNAQKAFGKPAEMLPLALATSIDALAVGVSFAFLQVRIAPAALFIGFTTLVIAMAGVKIGNAFGTRFKSKAELAGGAVLVLIGLKILLEHLS